MTYEHAYELQAMFEAGLQMIGVEDGELQWCGTDSQWQYAASIIENYATFL